MSEYEDYLIREATEGPSFQEVHEDYLEEKPVDPNDSTETCDQQGETKPRIEPYGSGFAIVWPDPDYPNGENWEGGYVTREAATSNLNSQQST